ncbi:hypothetical protein CK203_053505 [Vitis vinifera]|uniref:Uncharacterized protein n=1 Tax=Vitis vinifera TaxID=29760 RepID=A0A438FYW3_VITVI|nr:hypothetical protein CK203_035745 [Vitis vinifera]RVX07152.1 hypothetical protein CK203_053505 [Vitis vinifera]
MIYFFTKPNTLLGGKENSVTFVQASFKEFGMLNWDLLQIPRGSFWLAFLLFAKALEP